MQIDLAGRLVQVSTVAHDGVHEGGSAWGRWNFDPELVLPALLLVALYVRGISVWRDRSRPHPWWRTASYLVGVAVLLLSIESPLDAVAERHFSVHMVQHELLMMFAVPLILLGAPTTPILRGLPRGVRKRLVRPVARNAVVYLAYRVVTHPLTAIAAFTSIMWAWHLVPGWYDAALKYDLIHDAQHISFIATAGLLWWNVIDPAPLRSRVGYVARLVFLLAVSTPKSFLGALISFNGETLYDFYEEVEPVLNLTSLEDQQIGGLIMWFPSQMMFLFAAAVVFRVWAYKSEERQRAEDDAWLAAERAADARESTS